MNNWRSNGFMDNSEVTPNSELSENEDITSQRKVVVIEKFKSIIDSSYDYELETIHLILRDFPKVPQIEESPINLRNEIQSSIESFDADTIELICKLIDPYGKRTKTSKNDNQANSEEEEEVKNCIMEPGKKIPSTEIAKNIDDVIDKKSLCFEGFQDIVEYINENSPDFKETIFELKNELEKNGNLKIQLLKENDYRIQTIKPPTAWELIILNTFTILTETTIPALEMIDRLALSSYLKNSLKHAIIQTYIAGHKAGLTGLKEFESRIKGSSSITSGRRVTLKPIQDEIKEIFDEFKEIRKNYNSDTAAHEFLAKKHYPDECKTDLDTFTIVERIRKNNNNLKKKLSSCL